MAIVTCMDMGMGMGMDMDMDTTAMVTQDLMLLLIRQKLIEIETNQN
jgi:hypothetical protein